MLSPEQYSKLEASVLDAIGKNLPGAMQDYLDKHADYLDRGADAGLGTEVSDSDSSINQFSIQVPESNTAVLSADLFVWSDVVPNGFATQQAGYSGATIGPADTSQWTAPTPLLGTVTTSASTCSITSAEFATAGVGWQPPTWLLSPGGVGGGSGYFLGQQYQLTLMYLFQSVAMISNLNITSNENSQQAPVLTSVQLLLKHANPYGAIRTDQAPLNDAVKADQYRQNQVIIALHWVVSCFDWINLSTTAPSGSTTNVTFGLTFHARHKEAKGLTFEKKVNAVKSRSGTLASQRPLAQHR